MLKVDPMQTRTLSPERDNSIFNIDNISIIFGNGLALQLNCLDYEGQSKPRGNEFELVQGALRGFGVLATLSVGLCSKANCSTRKQ